MDMKNLRNLLTIVLSLTVLSCNAQIIPIEDYHDFPGDIPDGSYVKDVNSLLEKYIGTWIGVYGGNSIELYITEEIDSSAGANFDILRIRYKVLDSNNNVIVDTTTPFIDEEYVIEGMYFQDDDLFETYVLYYIGMGCRFNGDLFIGVKENILNEMWLSLYRYEGHYGEDCQDEWDDEFFPAGQQFMTLTKQ